MDPALIAVLVTLVADIIAKVLNSKKNTKAVEKTTEAVEEIKTALAGITTAVTQQVQLSTAINRRVEVLEHRVAYLENYRANPDLDTNTDALIDSAWPIARKHRKH